MVRTGAEEGQWLYWEKDVKDGDGRQEKKSKTSEKIHGCSKREVGVTEEGKQGGIG